MTNQLFQKTQLSQSIYQRLLPSGGTFRQKINLPTYSLKGHNPCPSQCSTRLDEVLGVAQAI